MEAAIREARAPRRIRILPLSVLALIALAGLLFSSPSKEPLATLPVLGASHAPSGIRAAAAPMPASVALDVAKDEPIMTEMNARRRAWQPEQAGR